MKPSHLFKCLLGLLLFSARSSAQSDSLAALKPEKIVTKHSIKIDNKSISYTATVGTLILKNEKDEPIASFVTQHTPKTEKLIRVNDLLHFHITVAPDLLPFGYI